MRLKRIQNAYVRSVRSKFGWMRAVSLAIIFVVTLGTFGACIFQTERFRNDGKNQMKSAHWIDVSFLVHVKSFHFCPLTGSHFYLSRLQQIVKQSSQSCDKGITDEKNWEWTSKHSKYTGLKFLLISNAHQTISYLLCSHWFVEFIWSVFRSNCALCSYFHFLCCSIVLIYTSMRTVIKHNEECDE